MLKCNKELHIEDYPTMKLVCYLFDLDALANLAAQVSRINGLLAIDGLAVVYRNGLSAESIVGSFSSTSPTLKCDVYPYAGKDWEFGAYQHGIDQIVGDGDDLIVLNDTVGKNYPLFQDDLRRFAQQIEIARTSDVPSMVGKVESIGIQFSLCDCKFDRWIRSNLFYLNASALDSIGRRVFEDSVFSAPRVDGASFSLGLPASESLEIYLARWMSPDPAHRGWLAHSGKDSVSDAVRRDKTGSIVSEKFLSARLLHGGGRLLTFVPEGRAPLYQAKVRWFSRLRKYRNLLIRSLRRTSRA